MPRASNTSARARQQSTRPESEASALRQALLEKKRIQDRESQRNVRQRTRDYIASLEAQVAELKSPSCIAHLLAVNTQLTAKVNELTATVEAISKLIQISTATENTHATQPSTGGINGASQPPSALPSLQTDIRGVEDESARKALPTPPQQQHFNRDQQLSTSSHSVLIVASPPERTSPDSFARPVVLEPNDLTCPSSNAIHDRRNSALSSESQHIQFGGEGKYYAAGLSQTANARSQTGGPANMPDSPPGAWDSGAGQDFDSMVIDSGYNLRSNFSESNIDDTILVTGGAREEFASPNRGGFVLRGPTHPPTAPEPDLLCPVNSPHIRTDTSHTPESDHGSNIILSQIGPPTSLWETQIIDSIKLYQSLVAESPEAPIFESENLDVRIFIQTIYTSWKSTPLTRLLVDAIQRWNFDIPERLGIYWLNYWYIKYRASPAKYASSMPEWFLPCVSQCIASHPIYIDTVPWPALRDKLTFEHENYPFSQFVAPFCHSLDVNWKQGPKETYDVNPDGSMTLSNAFVAHLRKLENWSLGPIFASSFPELAVCWKK